MATVCRDCYCITFNFIEGLNEGISEGISGKLKNEIVKFNNKDIKQDMMSMLILKMIYILRNID